jgi:hypothetical protein
MPSKHRSERGRPWFGHAPARALTGVCQIGLVCALLVTNACSSRHAHPTPSEPVATLDPNEPADAGSDDAASTSFDTPTATQPAVIGVVAPDPDAGSTPAEPPPVAKIPEARVVFTDAPAHGTPSQAQSQFSVGQQRELFMHTVWTNLDGAHDELRRIYSPDGSLFYEKVLAFSLDISEPVADTVQRNVPHEPNVRPVSADAQGNVVVSDYIGLAGTWIGDHGMTGDWRLEVFLDGASVPSVSSVFTLVP